MTRPRRRQAGEGRHLSEYKIKAGVRYWGKYLDCRSRTALTKEVIAARFPDP